MPNVLGYLFALAASLMLAGTANAAGDIFPLPDTLLPDPTLVPGTVVTADYGAAVMRGKLVTSRQITLDAPVSVTIDGISRTFAAGTVLAAWVKPEAGELPAVNAGAGPYFCSDRIPHRPNSLYLVIGDIGAKLEPWARFCFIDAQGKGRVDAGFLYGAKANDLQTAKLAAPAPYHEQTLVQANPKDEVRVDYARCSFFSKSMCLWIAFVKNGEDQNPQQIATFTDGRVMEFDTRMVNDPDRHPYPIHWLFLGASLGVESVDAHHTARFRINRNFAQQYVTPVGAFDTPVSAYYLYRGP